MSTFVELIENCKKKSYLEYIKKNFEEEKIAINKGCDFENELKKTFEKNISDSGMTLSTVTAEKLKWAREELDSGNVCAIDGTRLKPLDFISGIFCQVGVGSISYKDRDPLLNAFSITSNIDMNSDAKEYWGKIIKKGRTKEFDITAAMKYWEKEHALQKNEEWVFIDGAINSRELLEFEKGVELLEKVTAKKKLIGVIKNSYANPLYRLFGKFLKPGQYLIIENSEEFLKAVFATGTSHRTKMIREYIPKCSKYKRGVFKAKDKSYVFEIPEEYLDEGLALIFADAERNHRGIPQLIDLIDQKIKKMFEHSFYKDSMTRTLLDRGELMENINERELR